MTVLVTGGAGYIGSHIVRALRLAGLDCLVVDDLSSGHREFVPDDVELIDTTILDTEVLAKAMVEHQVDAVVHLAGFKYAGVSVQRPLHTYEQNVQGTVSLLQAMHEAAVDKIVFSSSAAVYGTPDVDIVTEATATAPESPYGESKLIGEWLLRDAARAFPLHHTSLRYFNVVGSAVPDLYDTSPHNLFPLVIEALLEGRTPRINGDDYPTPDGTCVRDYVHVADLADAHVVATQKLLAGQPLEPVYNLGSGEGVSVREIMAAVSRATGIEFEPEIADRRPGDPARIVASRDLAARDLDWAMRHSLDDMVASAWQARQSHA
jgi:UDP-glucose 4-epimerase